MKHIGILAHSADGAALCYLEMVREGARILGPHQHPEMTLSILPMDEALKWWEANDLLRINSYLMHTAQRLTAAGCDFFVCPDWPGDATRSTPRGMQSSLCLTNFGSGAEAKPSSTAR